MYKKIEMLDVDKMPNLPLLKMLLNGGLVIRFSPFMRTTEDGTVNEEHPTMLDYVV